MPDDANRSAQDMEDARSEETAKPRSEDSRRMRIEPDPRGTDIATSADGQWWVGMTEQTGKTFNTLSLPPSGMASKHSESPRHVRRAFCWC